MCLCVCLLDLLLVCLLVCLLVYLPSWAEGLSGFDIVVLTACTSLAILSATTLQLEISCCWLAEFLLVASAP